MKLSTALGAHSKIGKTWPRLGPASRRNLNGLRLLTTPRQPEHFYYRARETVLLKLVLWNCSQAALHAFAIVAGKYRSL